MMLYHSVKFEWNCCIPSEVIDQKPQFSQNLSRKGPLFSKNFADHPHFWTWPVSNDVPPFCKVKVKLMHPFKSYRSETKRTTTPMTMTTTLPTETWSLSMDYFICQEQADTYCMYEMTADALRITADITQSNIIGYVGKILRPCKNSLGKQKKGSNAFVEIIRTIYSWETSHRRKTLQLNTYGYS